jgi:SAM-dependent methyltransferase
MTELLVGAGSDHKRKLRPEGSPAEWKELITLDFNSDHKPDVVWDLRQRPLPFENDRFDEIHAYDVLEHLGQQGDWRSFFDEWAEWWRILKPNGVLCGISPMWDSPWAFGDPGHTRIVGAESFTYLQQPEYTRQVGSTPMTDYRFHFKADFDLTEIYQVDQQLVYMLKAIKPSRISI